MSASLSTLAFPAQAASGQNIVMAQRVIAKHTMSIPGFGVGERITVGPGPFSESDAIVLYALERYYHDRRCASESLLVHVLKQAQQTIGGQTRMALT